MTYQEPKKSLVLEAVEKAWDGSKTHREAAEKYLKMLREDTALREAATERVLERVATEDVSRRSRSSRATFKREAEKVTRQVVLKKGETSTPSVSLKNTASVYAKDMFERFMLPKLGISLGDATRDDLVQVVQSEEGLMRTHKRNHKFFSAILNKMPEDKIVRDVWTIEDVEKLHTETMAA